MGHLAFKFDAKAHVNVLAFFLIRTDSTLKMNEHERICRFKFGLTSMELLLTQLSRLLDCILDQGEFEAVVVLPVKRMSGTIWEIGMTSSLEKRVDAKFLACVPPRVQSDLTEAKAQNVESPIMRFALQLMTWLVDGARCGSFLEHVVPYVYDVHCDEVLQHRVIDVMATVTCVCMEQLRA